MEIWKVAYKYGIIFSVNIRNCVIGMFENKKHAIVVHFIKDGYLLSLSAET